MTNFNPYKAVSIFATNARMKRRMNGLKKRSMKWEPHLKKLDYNEFIIPTTKI